MSLHFNLFSLTPLFCFINHNSSFINEPKLTHLSELLRVKRRYLRYIPKFFHFPYSFHVSPIHFHAIILLFLSPYLNFITSISIRLTLNFFLLIYFFSDYDFSLSLKQCHKSSDTSDFVCI